ncbi:MAG: FG-GAP-like repeat-containing protein [Lewinella sp.]|uniref:FG-GAP-like repeat-containing protein n=1 Tax=Lewinella sp. TaxID=2004506 RepID=UPI003D6A6BE3
MNKILISTCSLLVCISLHSQSFTSTLISDEIPSCQGIIAHDFNSDGINEYVVTQFSQDKVLLLREDNGQIIEEELLTVDGPIRLGIGDYNLDGLDDILVIHSLSSGIKVLRNQGNLAFSTQFLNSFDFEKGREFVSHDFDQDGDLDLIVASPANDKISLFEMTSPGFFSFSVSDIDTDLDNVGEISTADFNGDGNMDIVTCARFGSDINIYLNDGSLNFSKINIDSQPSPLGNTTGDFNNDGLNDFAITDFSGATIIYINSGNNVFESTQIDVDIPEATSIESLDFNNDGNLDLAVAFSQGLAIYKNLDPTSLTFEKEEIIINDAISDIFVFDNENDENLDILGSVAGASSLYLFTNDLTSSTIEPLDFSLSIFPNPSNSVINITTIESNYIAKLYDHSGRLFFEGVNTESIDISKFQSGMYLLELQVLESQKKIFKKIVVTK